MHRNIDMLNLHVLRSTEHMQLWSTGARSGRLVHVYGKFFALIGFWHVKIMHIRTWVLVKAKRTRPSPISGMLIGGA